MNKLSKPISSPGRTDKFPPPLMRFLRSNVGSKSRRRSRASPMFVRKKNTLIETTQEPSSPKVTCIGQVRVRRSKKNNKTTAATTSLHHHHHSRRSNHHHCRCLKRIKPKSFLTVWTQCVSFFQSRSCCCFKSNNNSGDLHTSPSPVVMETITTITTGENSEAEKREDENVIEEKVDIGINEGLISRPTPNNALLLTRCRSAPYRSSSLASIFRESIMEKSSEEEEDNVAEKVEKLKIEKEDESNESKATPLILSRCKSAPARRWDQLLLV